MKCLDRYNIDDENTNSGTATGQDTLSTKGNVIESVSPIDGTRLASVASTTQSDYDDVVSGAARAFEVWRAKPAPERGEIIRQVGLELRKEKDHLGELVTREMGKNYAEGKGEVQEMIDICDFATGLAKQLYGRTMHSERPRHRMYEQWHPLGIVGIITAFNFPVAVYSWNAIIAAVCGNVVIWKPSEKAPLCSLAVQHIIARVLKKNNLPEGIFNLVNGDADVGKWLTKDERIPLISATGSIRMGKKVAQTVGSRLGKTILELGGNNAIIISEKADLDLAVRAVVFGAVGTAGQRCTSTRRLIIHDRIYDDFKQRLISSYKQLTVGNPMDEDMLVGPLIDKQAVEQMQQALKLVQQQGGRVLYGGEHLTQGYSSPNYVRPAICEVRENLDIVCEETFAPILYIMPYKNLEEAVALHNGVRQGLSSALFTLDIREAEYFLSAEGSDCGIANINIGTSGAEIGGAFGGEKETGGGRESGSDAWKAYMRRQTNTINWGTDMPLAQGIDFDV